MTAWGGVAREAIDRWGAAQDPHELAVLLAILEAELAPEAVLEIGGGVGGSAWAWSQLPSVTRIVTVTTEAAHVRMLQRMASFQHVLVEGDSREDKTVAQAAAWKPDGGYCLVFIDGDHHLEAVAKDYANYAPMAASWGLVVFHDTRDYPGREDHQVSSYWKWLAEHRTTTELVSHPGGPYGTGIVWARG